MTVQAVVLLVYGLPTLLAPKWWTALTQKPPLPENYILRAVGIAFIMLAWLEFKIIGDLERYRELTVIYGLLSARALRKLLERQLLELSQQLLNQRSKCRPVPVTVAS